MTLKRILLVQGHPDMSKPHLCHGLADAYALGAQNAGLLVRRTNVAELQAWEEGSLPAGLQQAQENIRWAEHIVFFFPLWLGDMPALLYRWYFQAHSIKSLERNILCSVGIKPLRETLIGMIANLNEADIGNGWENCGEWVNQLSEGQTLRRSTFYS